MQSFHLFRWSYYFICPFFSLVLVGVFVEVCQIYLKILIDWTAALYSLVVEDLELSGDPDVVRWEDSWWQVLVLSMQDICFHIWHIEKLGNLHCVWGIEDVIDIFLEEMPIVCELRMHLHEVICPLKVSLCWGTWFVLEIVLRRWVEKTVCRIELAFNFCNRLLVITNVFLKHI